MIKYDICDYSEKETIYYNFNFDNIYYSFKNNRLLTNNKQALDRLLKNHNILMCDSRIDEHLKYIFEFYLFKYFIDNLDEDGLEYMFLRLREGQKYHLKYVSLSLMAYIYYLESEDDSVVDKLAKKYIKDNLEERLRVIVKMIYNLNINVDDYFNWLDETVYTWKKHKLSFGQIGEYYKTDNLDNVNAGKKVETVKQNFCKYYILKKDLYSDKQDFIDTVAFSEILDALEGNFLDYLTRLDEANFLDSEIKQILTENENLEEFALLGDVEKSYLKELEQRLSTFPIKKNIPEYTKTILVKNYYADVQSVDVSTYDLTLNSVNNIHKTNFINNEIIYNFAKENKKYYLYDIKKKFEIDKEIAEEYLKNNYIMIKVSCYIECNKAWDVI